MLQHKTYDNPQSTVMILVTLALALGESERIITFREFRIFESVRGMQKHSFKRSTLRKHVPCNFGKMITVGL